MGVVIVEGEGALSGVNVGRPIATNGDGDSLFPNYLGDDLFRCKLYAFPLIPYHIVFFKHSLVPQAASQ